MKKKANWADPSTTAERSPTGLSEVGMDIQRIVIGTQCYPDHAVDLLLYRYAGYGGSAGLQPCFWHPRSLMA